MSYIDVRNLSINRAGFSTVVRTFSDNFNRASGPLGKNWIQTISPQIPTVDPITTATFAIGACTDSAQGVIMTAVGTINPPTVYSCGLICMPLFLSCYGISQFSEWLMVNNSNTGATVGSAGPCVLFQNSGNMAVGSEPNGLSGYYCVVNSNTKQYTVNRGNNTVGIVIFTGGAGSFANGDVIRLEAVVTSSSVSLTLKKNGTVLNSGVDNSIGRITIGGPGLFANSFDNSGGGSLTNQWRNFNGGQL